MKLNFCTLFNINYLTRGIVLYKSLAGHCTDFHLYIFAFDDICYNYFKKENYPNVTVISLSEFEDQKLLAVKNTRSNAEYCWTCSSSTILYCFNNFNLENCTYLDADLKFFDNPLKIWQEAEDKSVIITKHNYTTEYDQSKESGIYCVQFVGFRNNSDGLKVLNWWRNACLEWCYARYEDGKFGDQKYLDNWDKQFKGVHITNHMGAGIAPWNIQQFNFDNNNQIIGQTKNGVSFPVVFFHFHGLKYYKNNRVQISESKYYLSRKNIDLFYKPYILELNNIKRLLPAQFINQDPNGTVSEKAPSLIQHRVRNIFENLKKTIKRLCLQKVKKTSNYYNFIKVNS